MKRLFIVIVGLAALILALAFFVDAVNLETERADRWGMIFSFAAAMFAVGVLSSTATTKAPAAPEATDEVQEERDRRFVPAAPGSLKTETTLRVPRPVADLATTAKPPIAAVPKAPPLDWSILLDKSGVHDPPVSPLPAERSAGDHQTWSTLDFEPAPAAAVDIETAIDIEPAKASVEENADAVVDTTVQETVAEPTAAKSAVDTTVQETVAEPTAAKSAVDTTVQETVAEAAVAETVEGTVADLAAEADARAEDVAIHRMAARGEVTTSGPLTTQDLAMMLFLSQADDLMVNELASRSEPEQVIDLRDRTPANPGQTIAR